VIVSGFNSNRFGGMGGSKLMGCISGGEGGKEFNSDCKNRKEARKNRKNRKEGSKKES
jgi:hypothetical protein